MFVDSASMIYGSGQRVDTAAVVVVAAAHCRHSGLSDKADKATIPLPPLIWMSTN